MNKQTLATLLFVSFAASQCKHREFNTQSSSSLATSQITAENEKLLFHTIMSSDWYDLGNCKVTPRKGKNPDERVLQILGRYLARLDLEKNSDHRLISITENLAISIYSHHGFNNVNRAFFKDPGCKSLVPYVDLLQQALRRLPPHAGKVYSGMVVPLNQLGALFKPNSEFKSEQFMSTSKNWITARTFAATLDSAKVGVVLEIDSTDGRDISKFSQLEIEQEVLMLPGSAYTIKSIEKARDIYQIVMTQKSRTERLSPSATKPFYKVATSLDVKATSTSAAELISQKFAEFDFSKLPTTKTEYQKSDKKIVVKERNGKSVFQCDLEGEKTCTSPMKTYHFDGFSLALSPVEKSNEEFWSFLTQVVQENKDSSVLYCNELNAHTTIGFCRISKDPFWIF